MDVGILSYISNHMMVFKLTGSQKVPTLAEANTYEACLGALKDHANLTSQVNKDILTNMEGQHESSAE